MLLEWLSQHLKVNLNGEHPIAFFSKTLSECEKTTFYCWTNYYIFPWEWHFPLINDKELWSVVLLIVNILAKLRMTRSCGGAWTISLLIITLLYSEKTCVILLNRCWASLKALCSDLMPFCTDTQSVMNDSWGSLRCRIRYTKTSFIKFWWDQTPLE